MECDKYSSRSPNPSPPGMRSDTKEDGKTSNHREADTQLSEVSSSGPGDTEEFILLVASVQGTCREGSAFVIPVFDTFPIWHARNDDNLTFASFNKTIVNGSLGPEQFVVDDEPL